MLSNEFLLIKKCACLFVYTYMYCLQYAIFYPCMLFEITKPMGIFSSYVIIFVVRTSKTYSLSKFKYTTNH